MISECPNFTGAEALTGFEIGVAIAAYNVVSVLVLIGNAAVIFVILNFKRMRNSSTNQFILNLAIADILSAIFCIQFSYWPSVVLLYWPFGAFMCKAVLFGQPLIICVSSYTLVASSIERFITIMFPLRPRTTRTQASRVILLVWLLAILTAFPMLIVADVTLYEVEGYSDSIDNTTSLYPWCDETWQKQYDFSQAALVLQYLLPFAILTATYTGIAIKIWTSKSPGERSELANTRKRQLARPLILIMFAVSVLYALCWLPLNVLNIMRTMCPSYNDHPDILRIWWLCHLVAMSHSCLSPVVYVCTDSNFRNGFRYVFRWLPFVNLKHAELDRLRYKSFEPISSRRALKQLMRTSGKLLPHQPELMQIRNGGDLN